MKRIVIILSLIFTLAIALSASIPTLAADPDKDIVITGHVPAVIDVSVDDATLALSGDIIPGEPAVTAGAIVTIQSNHNWKIQVIATNGGKMWTVTSHTNSLNNQMLFTGGDLTNQALTGSNQTFKTGTKSTDGAIPVTFSQTGNWNDEPDDYDITITVTGSANP